MSGSRKGSGDPDGASNRLERFETNNTTCARFLLELGIWADCGDELLQSFRDAERLLSEKPWPRKKGPMPLESLHRLACDDIAENFRKLRDAAKAVTELPEADLQFWEESNADHVGSYGDHDARQVAIFCVMSAQRVVYHFRNLDESLASGGFPCHRLEASKAWKRYTKKEFSDDLWDRIIANGSMVKTWLGSEFLVPFQALNFSDLQKDLGSEFIRVRKAVRAGKAADGKPPKKKGPSASTVLYKLAGEDETRRKFSCGQWVDITGIKKKSTITSCKAFKDFRPDRLLRDAENQERRKGKSSRRRSTG